MKRFTFLILIATLLLSLSACGSSEEAAEVSHKVLPTLIPTFTPGSVLEGVEFNSLPVDSKTATEDSTNDSLAVAQNTPALPTPAAPTIAPEPTATTEPTATPKPTATEEPTTAPEPTATEEDTPQPETAESTTALSDTVSFSDTTSVETETLTETVESAAGDESAGTTLSISMGDLFFGNTPDNLVNPPVWSVASGQEITVELTNLGGTQHNWAVVKEGEDVPVPFMPDDNADVLLYDPGALDPGESKTVTFEAPIPGLYTVICTIPGHYPVMQGKLEVK